MKNSNSIKSNQQVLDSAAALAAKNADINNAITGICMAWSEKHCSTLTETYEYLEAHAPEDIPLFIGGLRYQLSVE